MNRIGWTIGGLLLATSGAASAQPPPSTPIEVSIVDFSSRGDVSLSDLSALNQQPILPSDCDGSITFRFNGVDMSRHNLYWFYGEMCDDPSVRTSVTTSACSNLAQTPNAIDGRDQMDVVVAVRDIVPCDHHESGVENAWVFALSDPNTDTVTGDGQQANFPLAYDFVDVAAPSGLTATKNGGDIELSWTAPTGIDGGSYDILVDPSACDGDGGASSPATETIADTVAGSSTAAVIPFPDGVPASARVGVAVRSRDRAGVAGGTSDFVCVSRSGGGGGTGGGGCAVAPGSRSPLAALAVALMGLALAARRRR